MNTASQIDPDVDPSGRRCVQQLLSEEIIRSACYLGSTSSTNSLALSQLAESPDLDSLQADCPRLFVADQQTSGRGRHGRTWVSDDQTLTFSLLIRKETDADNLDSLPLAVGVGVARAIEFSLAPLRTQLKWPNDVHAGGGKIAGILLETNQRAIDFVVIGIGVNVSSAPDLTDQDHASTVCDLATASGRLLNRYDPLVPIVEQVLAAISKPEDVISEFRERCLLCDQQIEYQIGDQSHRGRCRGVSDQGELLVETEQGLQSLRSGEARLVRNTQN